MRFFFVDLILVLAFVLIGRASHDEAAVAGVNGAFGTLVTLWPFAVGLVAGWLVSRALRAPLAIVRSGIPIWIATVALGMLLRVVSHQGIAFSFVVVATVVLGVFLLGWRAIVALVRRTRRRA